MDELFIKSIRGALNHLYDPDYLRHSPLYWLLGLNSTQETPVILQRILEDEIYSLKPKTRDPATSRGQMIYDLLVFRYLQQFSQKEVADQLGISLRQLAREQQTAVDVLASYIWEKYHVSERISPSSTPTTRKQNITPAGDILLEDLGWLAVPSPEKSSHIEEILSTVLELIQPLNSRYNIKLNVIIDDNLPVLCIHPVALRQILLNLLTIAIHNSSGNIQITTKKQEWGTSLYLNTTSPSITILSNEDLRASLEMAQKLAVISDCDLIVNTNGKSFNTQLFVPSRQSIPILMIDDSTDNIQLFERYTTDTRYHLISTNDPLGSLESAQNYHVQAIIMDIMMPHVDGWEMIGQFKNFPPTAHTPIIICSILPQEELALSLGSQAFLHKPISRDDLLVVLDQLTTPLVSISHLPPG